LVALYQTITPKLPSRKAQKEKIMPGTSFSVDLLITTPNQLRKIDFGLSKASKSDGSVEWTLDFTLNERKKTSDAFVEIVKLNVKVTPANNNKAEATAKKGLDNAQTSAALAAADSAKLFKAGKISKATAQADARRVIAVRAT
jgi:hypothetical protein